MESESEEATSFQSTSRDSTPPMVHGARNPPSLKAVTVEKLDIYSLQSFKKGSISPKLDDLEEENEETIHPTERLSISKEQEDEDDKFPLQRETPETEETGTILKSYQEDETPPLSNEEKTSTQGNEQQSVAHISLQTTPSDGNGNTCSDDLSEPIGDRDPSNSESESKLCVTKQSKSGIGVEFEEGSAKSGKASEMDVEAAGGSTTVEEVEKHGQQPEQTSELGKPIALKALTDTPAAIPLGEDGGNAESGSLLASTERKSPATEDVQEVERPSPDTKSRSSHLSLKRLRTNSKLSLFKVTKDLQPPQAKKLRLEDGISEKPQTKAQTVIRNQSEQDPSGDLKSEMSATICQTEKRETAPPRTSERSLLPTQLRTQTAPVLASHKRGKKATLNEGSYKPPLPLCTPVDTLTAACIVQCFDDYNAQLLRAQKQVVYRIKWGKPVASHSKQSSTTLDFKPKRRSTRGPRAKHASTGYSLDLSDLPDSKVESPVLPTASKITTPSDGESSPQQISSAITQEGQLDGPLKTTPSRQSLSLSRRTLNTSNAPNQKKQPSRTSVNTEITARAPTALYGETRLHDFSDSDDDLTPSVSQTERKAGSVGNTRPHTSSSPYCSPSRMDDKPTLQPSQTSPFRNELVPRDGNQPEHSPTHEGISTDTTNLLEAPVRSKRAAISPPPSEEKWISSRASRKSGGPVSSKTNKIRKPMLRVTTTRSRKRARILEDSSDSDVAGNSPEEGSTEQGRKQPRSKRPASVTPDAHSPGIGRTECNPARDDDNMSTVSSGHSSDSSLPPSFLLYAGSSTRMRQSRDGKTVETPKDKPAERFISAVSLHLLDRVYLQEVSENTDARIQGGSRKAGGGGSAAPPPFATFCTISIFMFAYLVLG